MTNRSSRLHGWLIYPLGFIIVCLLNQGAAAAKGSKVVSVDCAKGDSVADALKKDEDELVIEISGLCQEDVFIRRDNVTLRGTDPNNDGIQAVGTEDPRGAAVFVRDARNVTIENLKLTGGVGSGLRVSSSRRDIFVRNCRLEGNDRFGAVVVGSAVAFESVFVQGPDAGATAFAGGIVAGETAIVGLQDSTVNCGIGCIALLADQASAATVRNSTLTSGPGGITVNAFGSSRVTLRDSTISVSAQEETDIGFGFGTALLADGQGDLRVILSSFEGSFSAIEDSLIFIVGSAQTDNTHPSGNLIDLDSTLRVRPGGSNGSSLIGVTNLQIFSNAVFTSGDPARPVTLGNLVCADPGTDAFCQGPHVSFVSSTCGSCPPPAPPP